MGSIKHFPCRNRRNDFDVHNDETFVVPHRFNFVIT